MTEVRPASWRRKARWLSIVAAMVAALALVTPDSATSMPAGRADPGVVGAEQSVVQIVTTVEYQGVVGFGAGIVLSPDGIVLTNNHVVAGADTINAQVPATGQKLQGQLLGYNRTSDVAVIRLLGANGLVPAPIGDSNNVTVGEQVVSLGNADGMGSPVSREEGTVSSLSQNIVAEDDLTGSSERLADLIAVAAPIRPGDSGGPLVNAAGQVIGVTVAASVNYRLESVGKGFAIPINRAMAIAGQIQSGARSDTVHIGAPAMLGIGVATSQRTSNGVAVRDVLPGTPAEQAGLRRGDVITTLDGVRLENATTLTAVLDQNYPGDIVDIAWLDAAGQEHVAKMTLGAGPDG